MVLITIVTGAYKPTYNWGASHCSRFVVCPISLPSLLVLAIDIAPGGVIVRTRQKQ